MPLSEDEQRQLDELERSYQIQHSSQSRSEENIYPWPDLSGLDFERLCVITATAIIIFGTTYLAFLVT